MRNTLCRAAPVFMVLLTFMPTRAWAQVDVLVYSFETGSAFSPDGFSPNGGGVVAKVPGPGNTVGANSMNFTALPGDTFFGALTQSLLPAVLTSPNTTDIKLDLTIVTPYTGAFALVGVTYFGFHDPDDIPGNGDEFGFGTPFQSSNSTLAHIDGKAPGTYTVTIPLRNFGTEEPFNGPGLFNNPNPALDWDIGGFQLTFQKDNTAAMNVFIDNVRAVTPEPGSIVTGCMAIACLAMKRRRS